MLGAFHHRTHRFAGLVHNTIEGVYLSGGVLLMFLAVLLLFLAFFAVKAY